MFRQKESAPKLAGTVRIRQKDQRIVPRENGGYQWSEDQLRSLRVFMAMLAVVWGYAWLSELGVIPW